MPPAPGRLWWEKLVVRSHPELYRKTLSQKCKTKNSPRRTDFRLGPYFIMPLNLGLLEGLPVCEHHRPAFSLVLCLCGSLSVQPFILTHTQSHVSWTIFPGPTKRVPLFCIHLRKPDFCSAAAAAAHRSPRKCPAPRLPQRRPLLLLTFSPLVRPTLTLTYQNFSHFSRPGCAREACGTRGMAE